MTVTLTNELPNHAVRTSSYLCNSWPAPITIRIAQREHAEHYKPAGTRSSRPHSVLGFHSYNASPFHLPCRCRSSGSDRNSCHADSRLESCRRRSPRHYLQALRKCPPKQVRSTFLRGVFPSNSFTGTLLSDWLRDAYNCTSR